MTSIDGVQDIADEPIFEIGVDSLCWNKQIAHDGMTLEDVAREGRRLGARWLRLHRNHLRDGAGDEELEALSQRVVQRGQAIIWSGDGLGTASDGVGYGASRVRDELAKASRAGAALIQFYASWFRFDEAILRGGVAPEIDYLEKVLLDVVPDLEAAGMVLGLENHSNLTSTEMVELIERVSSDHVRVYLDVANPFPVSEEVLPAIGRLAPYSVAIDVKELAVRSTWASNQWHRKGYEVIYTWPGKGLLPWQEIWSTLGRELRPGPIPMVIEGLDEADDPTASAAESIAYMSALDGPRVRLFEAELAAGQEQR